MPCLWLYRPRLLPTSQEGGQVTVRKQIMYYVYVLKSQKDGHLYYGMTKDLTNRLKQHNSGLVKSTKSRRPFVLVYSEKAPSISEARKKEKYFKSGFGRKYLKNKVGSIV